MGIEFTTLNPHVQKRLQQFLDKMDTSLSGEDPVKSTTNAAS
jgi:hypothetical protein